MRVRGCCFLAARGVREQAFLREGRMPEWGSMGSYPRGSSAVEPDGEDMPLGRTWADPRART